jgi:hypothetical protein
VKLSVTLLERVSILKLYQKILSLPKSSPLTFLDSKSMKRETMKLKQLKELNSMVNLIQQQVE